MAKVKQKTKKKVGGSTKELDGRYLLKLVLYVIVGSLWLKITAGDNSMHVPIPVGLLLGLIFASHEHFQIDRKIEYAILLVSTLVGYWASYGLYLSF